MEKLWNAVSAIARVAIWIGGAMLFAAAAIVTAEVLLRKGLGAVFGTAFTFSGSDEISAYLFAVGTTWSMAHVLVTRGHVRIDALYGGFTPRIRAYCDVFALLVMGLFLFVLLERAWDVAFTSWSENIRSNTPLRIPIAWAQMPWFAGLALFALALLLALLRSLMAIAKGDYTAVASIAGATTQDEEIETELEGLDLGKSRTSAEK